MTAWPESTRPIRPTPPACTARSRRHSLRASTCDPRWSIQPIVAPLSVSKRHREVLDVGVGAGGEHALVTVVRPADQIGRSAVGPLDCEDHPIALMVADVV